MNVHLLGHIEFDTCERLQRHLAFEANARSDPRISLLLCEHTELITVGRQGSRAHIRADNEQLEKLALKVSWIQRGGGCIVHLPGQLAIYVVAPLAHLGWSKNELQTRLQTGCENAIRDLGVSIQPAEKRFGVWGRTGQLLAFGLDVEEGNTRFGAYLNVCPAMKTVRLVESRCGVGSDAKPGRMSCLLAERRRPATMSRVRSVLIEHLAAAFDAADDYHMHTGHVWLRSDACS